MTLARASRQQDLPENTSRKPAVRPRLVGRIDNTWKGGADYVRNGTKSEGKAMLARHAGTSKTIGTRGQSTASKAARSLQPTVKDVVESGTGQPIDHDIRYLVEERFGYDFSKVRIHSDAKATRSAVDMNASAYTVGEHIVFDEGCYSPRTGLGQRLLGHELAHVIQQRRRGYVLPSAFIDSQSERAASRAGSAVPMEGARVTVEGATAPGIARQVRSSPQNQNWRGANTGNAAADLVQNVSGLDHPREVAPGYYRISPNPYVPVLSSEDLERARAQVRGILLNGIARVRQRIEDGRADQKRLKAEQDQQPVTAWFSHVAAWQWLPDDSMWDHAASTLAQAEAITDRGDLGPLAGALAKAERETVEAHHALYEYRTGSEEGAGSIVAGLEIVRDVSLAIAGVLATIATGGVAGALIATSISTAGTVAQRQEEVNLGLRKDMDLSLIHI